MSKINLSEDQNAAIGVAINNKDKLQTLQEIRKDRKLKKMNS
jgi:hypothetical protein